MGLEQLKRAGQFVTLSTLLAVIAIGLLVVFYAANLLDNSMPQAFAPDVVASSNR